MSEDKNINCPHCSGKWNGIVGPGGSYRVTPLEKRGKAAGLRAYVCPKCKYTELFMEDDE